MKKEFVVKGPHKMIEWVEQQTHEWALEQIFEFYDVDDVLDLDVTQIESISEARNDIYEDGYGILAYAFGDIISQWEEEKEIYV